MGCDFLLCFDGTPPEENKASGSRGAQNAAILDAQKHAAQFAVPMADAPGKQPLACVATACCIPCAACYYRKLVLETYDRGLESWTCLQGVVGPICCCPDPATCCQGSPQLGLFCEGFCCPTLSLSVARIHLMRKKQVRPDPMDYKLIQCSNALQCLSCVCDVAAIIDSKFRDAATVIDCLADLFTATVAGCMGAQIAHEVKADSTGGEAPGNQTMERGGKGGAPSEATPLQGKK